jgi:cholesterol transport system auxiliary component
MSAPVVAIGRRRLIRMAALGSVSALAACQLPGQRPPPREFRLTPKTTFAGDLPKVDWALVVDRPTIVPSIDTVRIARTSGIEVEYYADATWVDRPAVMIEPLIIQSFQSSGAIEAVAGRRSDLRPDFMLQTDIEAFQARPVVAGPPEARVALSARLLTMPKRLVVGTAAIGRSAPAAAQDLPSIAAAFDDALGKVLKRLVEWTLVTGQGTRKAG